MIKNGALRVTIIYTIVSLLWIRFSDSALLLFTKEPKTLVALGSIKGYVFIIITSILIYSIVTEDNKKNNLLYNELKESKDALKDQYEKINFMAYYDTLTELPNRAMFIERLEEALKDKDSRGAVILLDFDDFKMVNDTLGHHNGDLMLKKSADILKNTVKDNGIVARIGGDEFLILINKVKDIYSIENICRQIQEAYNKPLNLGNTQINITLSIGIAIFPDDSNDINEIIKNADTAMYEAKQNGKNRYEFFNKSMTELILKRIDVERKLRKAVDNNEFKLVYQPQIDVNTKIVKGFEALIRWNNPELGNVPPIDFIPIAEQTCYIDEIGKWVLKTACKQMKEWKEKNYNFESIAVNLSPVQLQKEGFLLDVKKVLKEMELDPELLDIEITESAIMKSIEENVKLLKLLNSDGVKISVDDFGTGYSSLNYLRILPIDTIKIDKSFIDNICNSSKDKDIVDGLIQLSHRIKYKVIAEGVETQEQYEVLKSIGCDQVQGYYFSKPMPPEDIERLFLKHN